MAKSTMTVGTKSEGNVIPCPEKQCSTLFSNREEDASVFMKEDWATSVD